MITSKPIPPKTELEILQENQVAMQKQAEVIANNQTDIQVAITQLMGM